MYHFGKNLANLRKNKGFSQQDLANISGLSKRIIAYFENLNKIDTIEKLEKISNALNIPINNLLQFQNTKKNATNIFSNLDTRTLKKIKQLLQLSRQERSIVYKFIDSLSTKSPKKQKHHAESKN